MTKVEERLARVAGELSRWIPPNRYLVRFACEHLTALLRFRVRAPVTAHALIHVYSPSDKLSNISSSASRMFSRQ